MKQKIITLLSESPKRSFRLKDLELLLRRESKKRVSLKSVLNELVESGQVRRKRGGRYAIGKNFEFHGQLQVTRKGFGFVIVSQDMPDIFISRTSMQNAVHGDRVAVRIFKSNSGGRLRGKITRVINRRTEKFIGPVFEQSGIWYQSISPINPSRGIRVMHDSGKNLKSGEVAVTRVANWGTAVSPIEVTVEKLLGSSMDPAIDFDIIIEKFDYTNFFPDGVISELELLSEQTISGDIHNRVDLRHLQTFTIDPHSARDFDDALTVNRSDNGYVLWVHIADVSHFVRSGSDTDREAMYRGNSVYFTEGVIPMLPDLLASDLCSLKPGEDRFTLSVKFVLSEIAEVVKWEVFPAVIRSRERFTYDAAQNVINGDKPHALRDELLWLKEISEKLCDARIKKGSIDFDIPEPIFTLDDGGIPHEIRPSERLTSHRIVEECMLLANRIIAEGFGKKGRFVFRIHDRPDPGDVERLVSLLKTIGVQIPPNIDPSTSNGMRDVLFLVEDSPHKNLIDGIALRSMTKAKYSIGKREHFGLAFQSYTHFTSPIRRYPDLLVHRLVKARITGEEYGDLGNLLSGAVENANEMELKAQKAEREYIRLKQLRWLLTRIGDRFPGIISGVISIGFFVELRESMAEGLVHVDTLDHDDWQFDEEHYRLKGRRTGTTYQLGQEVNIRVIDVVLDQQKANFSLEP